MKKFAAMVLVSTSLLMVPLQAQENRGSGNYMLPLCKSWLRMLSHDDATIKSELTRGNNRPGGIPMYFMEVGMCAGVVVGISEMLPGACIPRDATNDQMVRVVVANIERYPEKTHEDFTVLAGAGLLVAWPCTKR